ncbi:hypothetical protein COCON_G00131270 [Conger conger]|uniref:Uncharacterized protein n=1 Tax=Conger conger TaxID=82655 RepID=A0A9Q1HWN8_CONCO|nr:hypothetical protein COCON_G00131270 [Conger conger]
MAGVAHVQEEPVLDPQTLPYRILRLPCDEVTTGGVMPSDGPLWPVEAPALPPAGFLPSLGDGFLYSYYPSVAPERQSVLSPSLDELSSRDDMFSTDLEDVESVSGRAYLGDGKPARVAGEVSDPGEEDEGGRWEGEEECPARETRLCAACGSCLKGGSRRGKSTGKGPWACSRNDEDVAEEVEDDCDGYDDIDDGLKDPCESWEEPVRKLQAPARHMQAPGIPWQKPKNGYSSEPLGPCGLEEQERNYPRGPECCEGHRASTKPDQCKGPNVRAQSRLCTDRQLVGADRVSTGQEYWETCGKPRPKFWKAYPSRGKVRPARRRAGCKTFVPQRFRRDYNEEEEEEEGEFVRFQRGRGSTKRRGARY